MSDFSDFFQQEVLPPVAPSKITPVRYQAAELAAAGMVGGHAWKLIQASRAKRFADFVVFLKRPFHEMSVGASHWGVWGSRTPSIVPSFLHRTLAVRKGIGIAGLGLSVIDPLENVRYIHKKDWERLAVNLRFPFVGIPIYNYLTGRSGSPPVVASPTNQIISHDVDRHRRTQSARNRQRASRPRREESGRTEFRKFPKINSAHGFRKPKAVSRRAGKRASCPPGYYWSWKKKTCVKSKYR